MNAYSCRPSDRPSDAGMHTFMCIAVLTSGICSDESCTVSDMSMRPSRGNCLVSDSVSSVRVVVLNPQVAIPFLRAQGAQVWGSGHFVDFMDSLQVQTLVGAIASGFPVLENNKCRAVSIESVLCTLYTLQTNLSKDCMVSSVSSPMPTFLSKPWCSLNIFHDDRLV